MTRTGPIDETTIEVITERVVAALRDELQALGGAITGAKAVANVRKRSILADRQRPGG